MNEHTPQPRVVSQNFSDPSAEIVCCSSDNILFRIHSRNLEVSAGGFPPPNLTSDNEIVQLTEDSSTLELMFQFMYPRPQPQLGNLPFDTLARLSEAVEKYQVYPAMQLCNIFMTRALPDHALEVLDYSVKHGYPALSDQAAPFITLEHMSTSSKSVSLQVIYSWLRYYHQWDTQMCRGAQTSTRHRCSEWAAHQRDIFKALSNAKRIGNKDKICSMISVPADAAACCQSGASEWRDKFKEVLGGMPPFTSYL